jgi:hypothetical protein
MIHRHHCTCQECQRTLRKDRALKLSIGLVCLALGLFSLSVIVSGCNSTVAPAPVESRQASYDHGEQNSGILSLVPGGALITPRARERYNALIAIYRREFSPALVADQGVSPEAAGNFRITNEALQKFILMNSWKRMGRIPGTK